MKELIYPFTYEQWLKHPSTKPKLKMIKNDFAKWRLEDKYGKQLNLKL